MSMKSVFALFGTTLTLLSGAMPAPLLAQVEPKSPVHVAVNGVFFLCPQLVRDAKTPSAQDLAKLGFEVSTEGRPGELSFKGRDGKWFLLASFDPTTKRCIVDYAGGGYDHISGMVRDTVIQNKFKRITGGDKDGAKADVFEGSVPKSSATARIIIIENYTSKSSSIAYSER
jgi:hypothetical protein